MKSHVNCNCLTPDGVVKGLEVELGGINVKNLDNGLSK
jgi:hypothetical protein